MLESLITSKTRLRLLIKFFLNIANKGYLNSLANEFGESTNSVRKELNNLSSAGYLEKHSKNNKVIVRRLFLVLFLFKTKACRIHAVTCSCFGRTIIKNMT